MNAFISYKIILDGKIIKEGDRTVKIQGKVITAEELEAVRHDIKKYEDKKAEVVIVSTSGLG